MAPLCCLYTTPDISQQLDSNLQPSDLLEHHHAHPTKIRSALDGMTITCLSIRFNKFNPFFLIQPCPCVHTNQMHQPLCYTGNVFGLDANSWFTFYFQHTCQLLQQPLKQYLSSFSSLLCPFIHLGVSFFFSLIFFKTCFLKSNQDNPLIYLQPDTCQILLRIRKTFLSYLSLPK